MRDTSLVFRLYNRQQGLCPICERPIGMWDWLDPHHTRCHDTEVNRKLFPHCVDHEDNITLVHRDCHSNHGSWGKWSDLQLREWEAQLSAQATVTRHVP